MKFTIRRCAIFVLGAGWSPPRCRNAAVRGSLPRKRASPTANCRPTKSSRRSIRPTSEAAELADLADQLKIDLEKNDRFVLSMATIRKTDDIEKLAKRIRSRLRHN